MLSEKAHGFSEMLSEKAHGFNEEPTRVLRDL